ncbi:hypothetical protein DRJ22_03495 [Candidatus Woesearchaeota archaeon]|nr:MAG: hypothetical protein DRJ22_03495 [Candidatus Woesearchaeota archaeon]
MRGIKLLTVVSVLIFLCFILLAVIDNAFGWIPDIVSFIVIVVFLYFTRVFWRLKPLVLTVLVFGLVLHCAGVFGWYGSSPLPVQWDHVSHFFGSLPFALLFWGFFSQFMDEKFFTKKNLVLVVLVFFASYGVCAFVELVEFIGYLKLGFGQHGALFFGVGDSVPVDFKLMDIVGGGWINEGWDLVYNTIGILTGLAIMFSLDLVKRFFKN